MSTTDTGGYDRSGYPDKDPLTSSNLLNPVQLNHLSEGRVQYTGSATRY